MANANTAAVIPNTHDAVRVLVLGDDTDARGALSATLGQVSEMALAISEGDLTEAAPIDTEHADLVLATGTAEATREFLHRNDMRTPRPVQIAILNEATPHIIRQMLRSGADEVLFAPVQVAELTKTLLKVSEQRRRQELPTKAGATCAISGLGGGTGVTTVATNLALALRYALKCKVALVDLDLQANDLAVQLNVEPQGTIIDAAEMPKLDSISLEAVLTKHQSGLYLLAGPKHLEEAERVTADTLRNVIDQMRRVFDYVIIDCGSHIDDCALEAWEQSDRLFFVVTQSVSAVRGTWRLIDLYTRLKTAAPAPELILNRATERGVISAAQVSNTLSRPLFASLPRDDKAIEAVSARGNDLWQQAPRSSLTRSFETLAHQVAGQAPETARFSLRAHLRLPKFAFSE